MKNTKSNYLDNHYIHRSNWLRAAVLGANDGLLSTASLAIGVAAASDLREPIILATVAGLVAGALSMTRSAGINLNLKPILRKY
ncbi:MAG: VIT1/CCC1 transporter family protein [Cyclobacteriaceae bacterium]